jgi:hypothetical protein
VLVCSAILVIDTKANILHLKAMTGRSREREKTRKEERQEEEEEERKET